MVCGYFAVVARGPAFPHLRLGAGREVATEVHTEDDGGHDACPRAARGPRGSSPSEETGVIHSRRERAKGGRGSEPG